MFVCKYSNSQVNQARFLQEGNINLQICLCWNIPEVRAMFGEYENEIREMAEFSIFYIPAMLRAKYAAK